MKPEGTRWNIRDTEVVYHRRKKYIEVFLGEHFVLKVTDLEHISVNFEQDEKLKNFVMKYYSAAIERKVKQLNDKMKRTTALV